MKQREKKKGKKETLEFREKKRERNRKECKNRAKK
jgi:hypothetical protein